MSASCNQSQGNNPPSSTLKDGGIHVNLAVKHRSQPPRELSVLQGVCPLDQPVWDGQTLDCQDRRLMRPWTYLVVGPVAPSGERLYYRQDEIRRGIWDVVAQQMVQRGLVGPLPSIIIDEDHLDDVKTRGSIEISFHDATTFRAMTSCMLEVRIQEPDGRSSALRLRCFSNSLEPGTLPFDLLRIPLASVDSKALFDSLNVMLAGVGSVVGLAEFNHTGNVLGIPHTDSGILRFYVKLSRSSMTIDFRAYALQIPTHFMWQGIPYVMQYNGRDMHTTVMYSADFPLKEEVDAIDQSSTSSGSAPASSSSSSTLVETSEESNKRKRGSM